MTDEPTRPTQYTSERVDRERRFHDALILSGKASIATKQWWETPGGRVRFSRRVSLLKQYLPTVTAPQRHRILVIGCGDGEWVNTISEFADVVGIDISPEIVANANRHLRNPAAVVEVGDAHRLNYADGTFDVCFANSTLHHLDLHVVLPCASSSIRIYCSTTRCGPRRELAESGASTQAPSTNVLLTPHFSLWRHTNHTLRFPKFGITAGAPQRRVQRLSG